MEKQDRIPQNSGSTNQHKGNIEKVLIPSTHVV